MTQPPSEAAVALSGGVDSSIAAHLLKEAGWKVHGVYFELPFFSLEQEERIAKVKAVAGFLSIPLHVIDLREPFTRLIINPFIRAYLRGFTPNPCIACNPQVKFAALYDFIQKKQIAFMATGHYARLHENHLRSHTGLFRGRDFKKDQSYFLHGLDQQVLSRTLFPLQEMKKEVVIALAAAMGLPSCKSRESQEICFLGSMDYRVFLERNRSKETEPEGTIVNQEGEVVGTHKGIHRYTVGQRHGLGIASPLPYYVKEIRAFENKIVVARREDLYTRSLQAEPFNWVECPPQKNCIELLAQIRYRHTAAPGVLEILTPSLVRFTFHDPQWAITPGQSLVCYQGDQVLGGGIITGP